MQISYKILRFFPQMSYKALASFLETSYEHHTIIFYGGRGWRLIAKVIRLSKYDL
jgi:hypothetical protein